MPKTQTTAAPATRAAEPASDDAAIGRGYLTFRRIERQWDETKARNPHDPQIQYGRQGPLTVERDEALRKLRVLADSLLDNE